MEVKIDTIVPTPSSLLLGGQIHGPKDAWVRFVSIELLWSAMPYPVLQRIAEYASALEPLEDLDEPLWL